MPSSNACAIPYSIIISESNGFPSALSGVAVVSILNDVLLVSNFKTFVYSNAGVLCASSLNIAKFPTLLRNQSKFLFPEVLLSYN